MENIRTRITTVDVTYQDNEIGKEIVNLDTLGAPSVEAILVQWCQLNSDIKHVNGCTLVFDIPINSFSV